MKKFATPEILVEKCGIEDVITASGVTPTSCGEEAPI